MKKYLFGMTAIVLAVGFSAFTTPKTLKSNGKTTFYKFTYLAPSGSYAKSVVENEAITSWGYGDPVNTTFVCTGSAKACEILVSDQEVIEDGIGSGNFRLRTAGDGGSEVSIVGSNTTPSKVLSTSTNLTSLQNATNP